jgi:transposase
MSTDPHSPQPRFVSESGRVVAAESLESLEQLNLNACGLDIGDRAIYACVPAGRDEKSSVRVFSTVTAMLYALADWLTQCGITTVAMESTGVYWIPVFQILEARGFEVILVNAQQIKSTPGRKTDILDCQWIQQLHTYGLLRASFRPDEQTCILRSYVRQRQMLIQARASHIQHMQKALQQMNLKLTTVISDITGKTGLRIVRDIVAGVRDPQQLSQHRDPKCRKSSTEIAQALTGDYRQEHLFALQQALELYDVYTEKVQVCDAAIEQELARFLPKVDLDEHPLPPRQKPRRSKNQPQNDPRLSLYQISGVDLTAIDGLDSLTVQTIVSEIGTDMSRWRSIKQFTAWLGLAPQVEKTGGKVLRTRTQKTKNRANLALRQAAASLKTSQSALGQFYRRMRARMGPPKAVVATAHKLARIIYHLLKHQVPFQSVPPQQAEDSYRQHALRQLQRQAQKLGAKVVIEPSSQGVECPC